MAYNPGTRYNPAPIGQGIAALGGGLAQGILERSRQRQKKEKLKEMTAYLDPILQEMSDGQITVKDAPEEAIPILYQQAQQAQKQKEEAPLRALQLENEKLRQRLSMQQIDEAATNAAALDSATPLLSGQRQLPSAEAVQQAAENFAPIPTATEAPADYTKAFKTYLAKGGNDPRMLSQLGALAQQQLRSGPRQKPERVDLGDGVTGVWDGNNFSRDPNDKGAKPTALKQLIEERDAWLAQGRPDVAEKYESVINTYGQKYDAFGNPIGESKPADYQEGARLRQNGVLYEYDGKNWNPVEGDS